MFLHLPPAWAGRWCRVAVQLLLWVVAAQSLRAQTPPASSGCTLGLAGRVADHETGEVLPGATARLLGTDEVSITDAYGNYHFHVCTGNYRLEISYVGYQPAVAELRITTSVVRNFQLHPDAVQLRGATVRGQRQPAALPQATATLSGRALAATRGQVLGEALLKVSGVTAIQTGPNVFKPMIHGLHSNRVALLNNGVRQEGQQWGQDHGPEIDPFVATELTVVKGAAGVRYGSDAVGGVVLVNPPPLPDTAGVSGELHLVGQSNNRLGATSATMQGAVAKLPGLAWRAQGTARRGGNTHTPGYWINNSALAEYDYSAALGWQQERWGTELFFSQFNSQIGLYPVPDGNENDIRAAAQLTRPLVPADFTYAFDRPYQRIRHNLLKLKIYYKLNDWGGRLTATVAQQADHRAEYDKFRQRNDARAAADLPELDYENRTTTAELLWEPRPAGAFRTEFGLAGTYQRNTYRDGSRYFMPFYTNYAGGAFGIVHWQAGSQWQLEAGLRADYRSLETRRPTRSNGEFAVVRENFQFVTPAASLGSIWALSSHHTLRLDGSLLRRPPAANERASQGIHNGIYEEGYDISRPAGAAVLTPETALNTALTFTWHDHPRFNAEVTAYQTFINGFIYQIAVPPVLTVQGRFPSYRYQQTDARFRGVDVLASYRLARRWTLGLKAATVVERDLRHDDYLIFAPADRLESWLRYEASATPGGRAREFYAQVGGQAVRRQTRLPNDYADKDYQDSPAGYALLNAEAGCTLRLGAHLPMELSVSGTNLLNTRYRDYLNRYRYYLDEMGRNVTLRLRVPLAFGRAG